MDRKKWLLLTALMVFIAALAGSLYVERYGNPIEMARTRALVEQYLQKRYPHTQFTYVKTFFHMKFDTYGGHVVSQGELPVEFTVERWKQGRFYDNYLSQKLSAEAEALVAPVIQSIIPTATAEIWVSASSLDNLPEDLTYTKATGLGTGVGVTWSNSTCTKDEFAEAAVTVRDRLKEKGFEINHYNFCCRLEGTAAWSLSLEEDQIDLTKEAILTGEKVNHWS